MTANATAAHAPALARVLVVDDDAAYRRILRMCLESIPGVEVVATARSVAEAQRALDAHPVDAVTLDVVLDGESGLSLIEWVHRHHPRVAIVMVTSGADVHARTEVDAILHGAKAMVRKPSGPNARQQLVEGLERALATHTRSSVPAPPVDRRGSAGVQLVAPRDLVAVGASTGGPPVVRALLAGLPSWFDVPVVITQHLPASHVEAFVAHLAAASGRDVRMGRHGDVVERGRVYVAGEGRHLLVARTRGALTLVQSDAPPEHHCRPAVDPLFRSVAEHVGAAAIGVVATGMGVDGAAGAVALRARGAPVVVQDRATSVVWGMPGAVVSMGAADAQVPGPHLAERIARWTLPRLTAPRAPADARRSTPEPQEER
jgi:two-component system chemotaxis response regulator CheB